MLNHLHYSSNERLVLVALVRLDPQRSKLLFPPLTPNLIKAFMRFYISKILKINACHLLGHVQGIHVFIKGFRIGGQVVPNRGIIG